VALGRTLILFAAILFVVYGAIFFFTYASSDDAAFLWGSFQDPFWATREVSRDGRILKGLFVDLLFAVVNSVPGLVWGRVIFVLGLWGLCVLIFHLAQRWGLQKGEAIALSIACVVSIPLVDLAGLIPSMIAPWAAILAGVSIFLLDKAALATTGKARWGHRALALFTLFLAFGIYQPTAMMVVFFSALALFSREKQSENPAGHLRTRALFHAGLVLGAGLLAFLFFMRLTPALLSLQTKGREVFGFVLVKKVAWFLAVPLKEALNPFFFFAQDPLFGPSVDRSSFGTIIETMGGFSAFIFTGPNLVGGIAGLFLVAGIWLKKTPVPTWALMLAHLPAAFALNLVVADYWSPPRTQLPLASVILLFFILALRGFGKRWPKAPRQWLLIIFTAALVVNGFRVHTHFVSRPLAAEWAQLKAHVQVLEAGNADLSQGVFFRRTPLHESWAPGVRYELGRPATFALWAPSALFNLAWKELSKAPPPELVVVEDTAQIPNGAPRIVLGGPKSPR
jgi:hypothetical protein